jgi:3-methyladenine DNA glycosylase AlkD
MRSPVAYLEGLKELYQREGDPERALGQARYMRHQFEFYGLKAKEWLHLFKNFSGEHGMFTGQQLRKFIRLGFDDDYREIQYTTVEMSQRQLTNQKVNFINDLEYMITTKSWWDTVDWLAKLAGSHFLRYPELRLPTTGRWINSDDMWLRRSAILFQLSYKEKTDEKLLFDYILREKSSKEFFIQKASGWALRQYSRINPEGVVDFIEGNNLSNLTKREGLKWLKRSRLY